jgi:Protein of unknown function (DUF2851)
MEEQLLHFIWHRKLFNHHDLETTTGEAVEIFHYGFPNQDQGPDFLQARIQIGEQLWAGHVEIHIRSSAWFLHMHEQDSHYNNVILHVVWEEDQPVFTQDGFKVPCIALANRVDSALLDRYRHLMNNEEWIPCASSLMTVPDIIRSSWLQRLMAERLEHKTDAILRILSRCNQHWEQVFFVLLLRQLGAPANSDAMEELGIRTPISLIRKHGDRIDQIEAILFGTAGMLQKELNDPYILHLKKEFDFLRKKYDLQPMPALRWKFMRMRPAHFPTIRIAQTAKMVAENNHFISLIEHQVSAKEWIRLFSVKPHDAFWQDHYHFVTSTPPVSKQLGKNTAMALVINVVSPIMFVYGKHQGMTELKERAIFLLEEMPAEKNSIISGWQACGWNVDDAGQTQALLHLKKNYCDKRRCLHCAVGMQVIR